MLPQRQRAGRGRVALLLGCSVAGFLLLVLLAHPSLLPWNASPSAGMVAGLEAAVAAPPLAPLAEGEELHLDLDMVQQQRLIESIHKAGPCWTPAQLPGVSLPVAGRVWRSEAPVPARTAARALASPSTGCYADCSRCSRGAAADARRILCSWSSSSALRTCPGAAHKGVYALASQLGDGHLCSLALLLPAR